MRNAIGISAILMIAGASHAQVVNPSFEIPGLPIFDGWEQFGGNIGPDLDELILDGDVSLKIFGGFTGGFNVSGVFQNTVSVNPGEIWECSINAGHITGDELQPGARAFMSIVYRDANGVNLYDAATDVLLPGDPTDTFILSTVSDVAPLLAADVQIVLGFIQEEPTGDNNGDTVVDAGDQATGAAHYDVADVQFVSAGNPIPFRNGSFEDEVFGREAESWTSFGNSIGNVGRNFDVPNSDGDVSLFIFGQFNGMDNDSGVFQGVPAAEGETWEASVKVRPNPGDEPAPGNEAFLSLVFLDASGNVLSDNPVLAADSTTSSAAFIDVSVSETAPAGTAEAQIVLVYVQRNDGTGAVIFDEANLAIAASRLCADQNGDGMVTPTDFNAWIANFNANNLIADVNQDGMVSPTDFNAWIGAFNQGTNGPTCTP